MSANTKIDALINKLEDVLEHDERVKEEKLYHESDLTEEERKMLKTFLRILVAFRRLGGVGSWIILSIFLIWSNSEAISKAISDFFSSGPTN